ncbi:hypothetical protein ABPG74_006192 [Tetrahymena malaccensis]
MSAKIKPKQPQKRLQCAYCKEKIDNENYYLCECGYQMCWDCYDDFQDNQEPYCPKCDAELISDSEDEQITKPKNEPSLSKSTSVQNQGANNTLKSSPSAVNKSSSSTVGAANSASSTISTSSINTSGFNYNDLAKVRVIKKNLVYVIGLAPEIANEETLLKKEYFSQYGKITKIVVNTNNAYNPKGPNGPSYSAYITYSSEREASMAILGTEEYQINDRIIRASYGTTKYCSFFLKQQECPNLPDCLYLHSFGKDKEFFQKDEATSNKNIFIDQQKMAIKNIQKYIPDLVKIKNTPVTYNSVLPTPQSVIEKLIEQDVLDIKQKPAEQNSNEQKGDKKKKEDNTPLIDQWSIDFSIPQTAPKKDKEDSRKQESSSPQQTERKQSKSISEKDLNTTNNTQSASKSPQQNQQNGTQSSETSQNKQQESEKPNKVQQAVNGQQQNEEKTFSKEEFIMKAMNGVLHSPSHSHSSSLSLQSNTNQTQNQNITQNNSQGKTQPQSIQNNIQTNVTINNSNTNSNLQKAASQVVAEQTKKVEKSPIKEQTQKQDEQKKDEQIENRKAGNASAGSSNQSSNVASTNHSRTSSTNQKATGSNTYPQQNQASNTNGINNKQQNSITQNGSHIEKKETSRKEQSESKQQKHQYIPVNQQTKQASQSVEPQKEANQQTQNLSQQQQQQQQPKQQSPAPHENIVKQKEDNKQVKSSTAPQQKPQNSSQNSQQAQVQQQNPQNEQVNNLAQSKQQNTQNGLQQQVQISQNHNIQISQHLQNLDNSTNSVTPQNSIHPHHQHTVSEPIAPKYILQKVEKRQKTLSSDNQIMKRLITRTTHQKSASSRFDFAKNSENSDQPVEDVDVINHIFNGQYIILTKSYSQSSSNFDKSEY